MDSPVTTPTSMNRDIKVLHLESTDVCQAACPACSRVLDPRFNADAQNHLTMPQILQHFDADTLSNLHKMYMCGNYGDPAAGFFTQNIMQQFRQLNTDIVLGMHSNGGLQNQSWWTALAGILNQENDYVVFSIDGLEDTNHIYRVNVDWNRLINNVKAFVNAGGRAHWDMLIYQHNEHQVDQCLDLARSLGFSWFRAKVSRRSLYGGLQYPTRLAPPQSPTGQIHCRVLAAQEAYIDARGNLHPCCWLGATQQIPALTLDEVSGTWSTASPNPVCSETCRGSSKGFDSFGQQWRREVALC